MNSQVTKVYKGAVCLICINRPDKKNAITLDMYQMMADALLEAADNRATKVVVLGSESEHFTSGNDLGDFLRNPSMDKDGAIYQFLSALIDCPLPVVAAVQGFAIGIGATLLLHCDQVIADETATFAFPFVNLGLVPEAGSSLLLPRLVGYQKAADWLLTGDSISAREALAAGLVAKLVPEGQSLKSAIEYAEKLAGKSRETLIRIKQLLRRDEESLHARVDIELEFFVECLNSVPAKEAMTAFLQKRKPDFKNL